MDGDIKLYMVSQTHMRSEFRLGPFVWAFAMPAVILLAIGLGLRASLFEWPRAGFVVIAVLTVLLFGLQLPKARDWQMSLDGERRVIAKLRRLPRGWLVYSDVDLGSGRCDHVSSVHGLCGRSRRITVPVRSP